VEGLFTPVIHFSTGLQSIIQKIAGPLIPATTSAVDQLVNRLSAGFIRDAALA
jgi:hypothetical protein